MSFDDAVSIVLSALCARGPGGAWEALSPLTPLLLRAGPVPRGGPLTHDFVVPGRAVGWNVFDHGGAGWIRDLRPWAAGFVPPDALAAVEECPFHGGPLIGPAGPVLKLYATTEAQAGIDAIGLDLTRDGLRRRRSYRHEPAAGPHVAHGLTVSLPGEKVSHDTIFVPSAPLSVLLDRGAPPWLAGVDRALAPAFVLRSVAWEVDRYETGEVVADCLVAIGTR
jgi:hypothetical protein